MQKYTDIENSMRLNEKTSNYFVEYRNNHVGAYVAH